MRGLAARVTLPVISLRGERECVESGSVGERVRGRRESERERTLLRAEEEEEKEDGKGMTMVKGRGTEVGVGGEPSKEGAKRGGTGEREERIPAESSPRRLE